MILAQTRHADQWNKTKPRHKHMYVNSQQAQHQTHNLENKRKHTQQKILKKMDVHIQKNEIRYVCITLHKM